MHLGSEFSSAVQNYLEEKTGDVSNNDYMVINVANAMGLPAQGS